MNPKIQKEPQYNQNPEIVEKNETSLIDIYTSSLKGEIEESIDFPELTEDEKTTIIHVALESLGLNNLSVDDMSVILESAFDLPAGSNIAESHPNALQSQEAYWNIIRKWLQKTFCTPQEASQNVVSDRLSAANKFYSATLSAHINKTQRELGEDEAKATGLKIERTYYNGSPCIFSHVGQLSDAIELYSFAQKGSVSRELSNRHMPGEIIYNYSWHNVEPKHFLQPFIDSKSPINDIYLLNIESRLSIMSDTSDWSKRFSEVAEQAIVEIANDPTKVPFERIVAQDKANDIERARNVEYTIGREISRSEAIEIRQKDPEYQRDIAEQADLHRQFPIFNENERLVLIAPGICARKKGGAFDILADFSNVKADLSEWQFDNQLGLTEDDSFLLKIAHGSGVKELIESGLGIQLNIIPLDTQTHIFRFMIEANDKRYAALLKELSEYTQEADKLDFINAFMALEFGDDFGDRLLTISDRLGNEESLRIFRDINQIRDSSKVISESFKCSVPGLDSAMQVAWLKRTTELLAVLADPQTSENEMQQAIEALDVLCYASKQIEVALGGEFKLDGMETGRRTYKSIDGEVTITARTSGSSSQRIGFKAGIPPELTPSASNITKKEKLSIRFDHDDTYRLALDIGSSRAGAAPADASNISHFIADQMEKGEEAITGERTFGNHVCEAFLGKISELINNNDDFALVVDEFVAKLRVVSPLTLVPGPPNGKKHISQSGSGIGA